MTKKRGIPALKPSVSIPADAPQKPADIKRRRFCSIWKGSMKRRQTDSFHPASLFTHLSRKSTLAGAGTATPSFRMSRMSNDGGAQSQVYVLYSHRSVMGRVPGGASRAGSWLTSLAATGPVLSRLQASVVNTGLERIKREVPSNSNFCWLFVAKYQSFCFSAVLVP